MAPPVEALLLDLHHPSFGRRGDPGIESCAQRGHAWRVEQRQRARAFGVVQPLDVCDQVEQLRLRERLRIEREGVAARVLEVPLDAHRTQQEQADRDG